MHARICLWLFYDARLDQYEPFLFVRTPERSYFFERCIFRPTPTPNPNPNDSPYSYPYPNPDPDPNPDPNPDPDPDPDPSSYSTLPPPHLHMKSFSPSHLGDVIIQQNDEPTYVYFIVDGEVEIVSEKEDAHVHRHPISAKNGGSWRCTYIPVLLAIYTLSSYDSFTSAIVVVLYIYILIGPLHLNSDWLFISQFEWVRLYMTEFL